MWTDQQVVARAEVVREVGAGVDVGKRGDPAYTQAPTATQWDHTGTRIRMHTRKALTARTSQRRHMELVWVHITLWPFPQPPARYTKVSDSSQDPLLTTLTYAQVGGWELGAGALLYTHIHCFSSIIQIIHFQPMLNFFYINLSRTSTFIK